MPHPLNQLRSTAAAVAAHEDRTRAPLEKQLFNVQEVAACLGISTASVWRYVKRKALPSPIRIGGSTRWRRIDLEAFLDAAQGHSDAA